MLLPLLLLLLPQNHRGEKLIGTLTEPDTQTSQNPSTPAPKPPVVILAHGYMSTRNSELLVRLATALTNSFQLSSLRFDFSGNGDSEGQFRYGQYRCDPATAGSRDSLADLQFASKCSDAHQGSYSVIHMKLCYHCTMAAD